MRILILSDLHHGASPTSDKVPARAVELVQRTWQAATHKAPVDVVILAGDLMDDPQAPPGACEELAEGLSDIFGQVPLLVATGNHDPASKEFLAKLGARPGGQDIGGCRFFVFRDRFDGDFAHRPAEQRRLFARYVQAGRGSVIAIQHNPVAPEIPAGPGDYPYMHTNRSEVLQDYAKARVALSVSGHYHAGQPVTVEDGVTYKTVGALCEPPHSYALAEVGGDGTVRIAEAGLALPDRPSLWDCHAHTEYAYCGTTVSMAEVLARGRHFGLAGTHLVEHSPQLYCTAEAFWAAAHVRREGFWKQSPADRMADYLAKASAFRDARTRIGLEIEVTARGEPILLEAHRREVDVLLGAVHWLADDRDALSEGQFVDQFLFATEALVNAGIDVLAHPFRIFGSRFPEARRRLYPRLASLLAANGVAAEVNFHINRPDAAFFRECVARGVRIAVGSDAHALHEAAGFHRHLAFLDAVTDGADLQPLLWPEVSAETHAIGDV